jgi:hypothetical protein
MATEALDLTALRAAAAGLGFVQRADLLRLLEEVEAGRATLAAWQDITGHANPEDAAETLAQRRMRIAELEAEVAALKLSITGRDKAYKLLNAGFESAMDLQAELQQKVRALEASCSCPSPVAKQWLPVRGWVCVGCGKGVSQ